MRKITFITLAALAPLACSSSLPIVYQGKYGHGAHTLVVATGSAVLVKNLARSAGGLADDGKAVFKDTKAPAYLQALAQIEKAHKELYANPRVDMPGAKPAPHPQPGVFPVDDKSGGDGGVRRSPLEK